jgi:hypothetical protein
MTCEQGRLPLHSESTEGTPVKTEQQQTEQPNPLEQFSATLAMMAHNRALLEGLRPHDQNWTILLQDLAMLVDENVTIGLRTPWVRRVAVPVWYAYRKLSEEENADVSRVKGALEILRQCSDVRVQTICSQWLRETRHAG